MGISTLKNHRLVEFFKTMFLCKKFLSKNVSLWGLHLLWCEVDQVFVQSYRKWIFHIQKAFGDVLYPCWGGSSSHLYPTLPPPMFEVAFLPDICTIWLFVFSLKTRAVTQVELATLPSCSTVLFKLWISVCSVKLMGFHDFTRCFWAYTGAEVSLLKWVSL